MQAATENRCKGVRVGTPAGYRGAGGEGERPDTFPEQLSDGAGTQWLSRCALEPTQAPPVCRESSLMGKPPVIPLQGEKKKNVFLLLALAKQTSQPPNKSLLTKSPPLNKIRGRKRGAVLTPVLLECLQAWAAEGTPKKGGCQSSWHCPPNPHLFPSNPVAMLTAQMLLDRDI